VLDLRGQAIILKASGETLDEADRPIGGPEQQRPGIGGDQTAVEGGPTARSCTGAKPNKSALHSVGIGASP
jgi:hypothetical protein